MNKFYLRKGEEKDCPKIIDLILELAIYEKAEDKMILTVDQLKEDGFSVNPKFDVFVVEDSHGEVFGIALFYEKYSTWTGACIYLEDLIVTKDKRGIGAGKALFEAVIKEAKRRNSARMEWQVLDWNVPSIDFYKAYGAELDNEWVNGRFYREQIKNMEL